ncbi:MJ0042-type zinc finger domain-containing protein [Aestuariispira insulae]|uniref:Putative Zn finger-like uncharacterized protein n=1 Tax=Aestuariispira insulae TaxID=1461337 RepID=A0A3D9H6C9_9PROT|nr:MJ0042-type zinc finger domain-containing protein [Aestuariispira insulae]RED45058.1 putative Zn finger-like uncharacterized protein [Aestuariispira insulae]
MILSCPNCATKFKVNPNAIPPEGRSVKCAKCSHRWHADPEPQATAAPAAAAPPAAPAPTAAAAPPPPPPPVAPPEPEPEPEPAPPPPPPPAAAPEPEPEPEPEAPSAEDAPMEEDLPPPPPPEPHLEIGDDLPPIPPEGFQPQRASGRTDSKGPLIAWAALGVFIVVFGILGYFLRFGLVESYPPLKKVYTSLGIEISILGNGLDLPQPTVDREITGEETTLVISGTATNVTDEPIVIPKIKGILLNTQNEAIHVWVFEAINTEALPGESVAYETRVVNPPRGAVNLNVTFVTDEEAHMLENEKMPMDGEASMPEQDESSSQ